MSGSCRAIWRRASRSEPAVATVKPSLAISIAIVSAASESSSTSRACGTVATPRIKTLISMRRRFAVGPLAVVAFPSPRRPASISGRWRLRARIVGLAALPRQPRVADSARRTMPTPSPPD